jgi:hypothetical protein
MRFSCGEQPAHNFCRAQLVTRDSFATRLTIYPRSEAVGEIAEVRHNLNPRRIMKTNLKKLMPVVFASALFISNSNAQVLMSAGNYSLNFNNLETNTVRE